MKQRISVAHLSVAITLMLIVLSFGFGFRSYLKTERLVISDLNQALQHTVLQHKDLWLNTDTIHTYARLQAVMGGPVSVSSSNRKFTEALSIPQLRDISSLSLHIVQKNDPVSTYTEIPTGYLSSDTLLWLSTAADVSGLTLTFRGYAHCSTGLIFSLSDQTLPALLLLTALLWGTFSFFYFKRRICVTSQNQPKEELITFGNLSLSLPEACFYNENMKKLKLTPMQYALMELFYRSPSHLLLKSDICQSLWPGKDNADETLYTLIRRLKPIIENYSNLKITTDRGRAYELELKD